MPSAPCSPTTQRPSRGRRRSRRHERSVRRDRAARLNSARVGAPAGPVAVRASRRRVYCCPLDHREQRRHARAAIHASARLVLNQSASSMATRAPTVAACMSSPAASCSSARVRSSSATTLHVAAGGPPRRLSASQPAALVCANRAELGGGLWLSPRLSLRNRSSRATSRRVAVRAVSSVLRTQHARVLANSQAAMAANRRI